MFVSHSEKQNDKFKNEQDEHHTHIRVLNMKGPTKIMQSSAGIKRKH